MESCTGGREMERYLVEVTEALDGAHELVETWKSINFAPQEEQAGDARVWIIRSAMLSLFAGVASAVSVFLQLLQR